MADPANFDTIQAAKAQEAQLATHQQALQQFLAVFDPTYRAQGKTFLQLLRQAQTVLTTAIAHQEGV